MMPDGLMRRWIEPQALSAPEDFRAALDLSPLAADILYRRGLADVPTARAFLDPDHYTPALPEDMPGVSSAVTRIQRAIALGEALCVWGDYDVDGQTSAALLVSAFQRLGAKVSYHLPVRATEGYGVHLDHLKAIIEGGANLLVTCDTGIAAHEAVTFAKHQGVDTIITDHHTLPPGALPEAYAIVTPRLLPDTHPLSGLPGVGTAYELVSALYQQAGLADELSGFLDLVALGIVADIAPLRGDTRYLLQKGLTALRETRRAGLLALMQMANLNPSWLTEEHIGFVLAPRLNALGRLDDANPAVELLTTSDEGRARVLATHLEGLNAQRRNMTTQVLQGALAQIAKDRALLDYPALVLAHPDWPGGVIGIVAAELAARFTRPVLLLASPTGQVAHGSARSVEGVDITAALAENAALLTGFGGHPMAAGCSIDVDKINALRRGLSRAVEHQLGGERARPSLEIVGEARLTDFSLNFVAGLERLAPFGSGNPSPVLLVRDLKMQSAAPIGREGEHVQVIVEDGSGEAQRVMWWRGASWPLPEGRFDLACTVRASNYRGQRAVQVEWIDARPIQEEALTLRSNIEVIDYRAQAHPLALLKEAAALPGASLWAEGQAAVRTLTVRICRAGPGSAGSGEHAGDLVHPAGAGRSAGCARGMPSRARGGIRHRPGRGGSRCIPAAAGGAVQIRPRTPRRRGGPGTPGGRLRPARIDREGWSEVADGARAAARSVGRRQPRAPV